MRKGGKGPPTRSAKKATEISVETQGRCQERTRNVFGLNVDDFAITIHAANLGSTSGDGNVVESGAGDSNDVEGVLGQGYLFEANNIEFESIQDAAGETTSIQVSPHYSATTRLTQAS